MAARLYGKIVLNKTYIARVKLGINKESCAMRNNLLHVSRAVVNRTLKF
jgi:hypothetical protein